MSDTLTTYLKVCLKLAQEDTGGYGLVILNQVSVIEVLRRLGVAPYPVPQKGLDHG